VHLKSLKKINLLGPINMAKNKFSTLILVLLLIIVTGCSKSDGKNYLTIKNVGTEVCKDVKIEFSNGSEAYLGILYPSCDYKFKLLNSVNENAISLSYTDNNNKVYNSLVIPYLVIAENKNYTYSIK